MTELERIDVLYDAFARHDGAALGAMLAPSFAGHVSDGMPGGAGEIGSPAAMMAVWMRAAMQFDVHPRPDEVVQLKDGRVLVLGHYVGAARKTGKRLDAVFAHVWRFEGDQVTELVQVTDTARWHEALRA
jgi:ketosteroid isomerase-like protein